MTSISDIADAAGVSVASVSRVFNRRPNVRPEVAERVLACARELGYRPRQSARRDCVALVVGSLELGGYGGLVVGAMAETARARDLRLDLVTPDDLERLQARLPVGVVSVLPGPLQDHAGLAHLRELGAVPVVTLNHRVGRLPRVRSDDRAALRDAVTWLAERHHRRIALLTVDNDSLANRERRAGWEAGLRAAGLAVEPALHQRCRHGDGTVEACARLLRAEPDAVIATGEEWGPRVAHALDLLGRRIGRDLSLVTHELPGVSAWQLPPHTTIAQDFAALAGRALDLVLDPSAARRREVVVPCTFHPRESTRDDARRDPGGQP